MQCPDSQRLEAFLSGRLSETEISLMTAHLSACRECESVLETLESGSCRVALLGAPGPNWEYLREDGLLCLEAAAGNLATAPESARPGANGDRSDAIASGVPRRIGQYELQAKLGQGGMGAVYRARHVNLKREVAVKLLPAERGTNQLYLARFYREMEAMGKINSPFVVCATDAGEANGWHFLAMEYVPGIDVGRVAQAHGPLSVADACEIVRQAAWGLAAIDERGLVHRDIKPSNLLLTESGHVKILDLGLARLLEPDDSHEELTGSQNILGTVAYMAPEQISNLPAVDIRADIYSLGCTLYKLLVGNVPFGGSDYESPREKMLGHLHALPKPVQSYRRDVPDALAGYIHRMLAKDPRERYARPGDVAEAMAKWSGGHDLSALGKMKWAEESISAISTESLSTRTFSEPAVPGRRRQMPKVVLAIAGAIATLSGLVALAAWSGIWNLPSPAPQGIHSDERELRESADFLPRVFERLGASQIEPKVQYMLLNVEPTKLFWPDDVFASQAFAPQLKQVSLISKGLTLSSLGQMSHHPYRFSVDLYQNEWKGNIGVFWGFQRTSSLDETAQWQYQLLDFRPNIRANRGEFPLVLWRNVVTAHVKENGEIVHSRTSVATVQVPVTQWEGHQLEIRVDRDLLSEVRWRGQPLPDLCGHQAEEKVAGASHTGSFGIYVNGADGIFRNSQITWLQGTVP